MAKHRAAKHRAEKKRPVRKHGVALVAAPVAATITLSTVGVGYGTAQDPVEQVVVSQSVGLERLSERAVGTSRSASRADAAAAEAREAREARQAAAEQEAAEQAAAARAAELEDARATERAVAQADTRLWTTEELNLWSEPGESAAQLGTVPEEEKVLVTGRSEAGRDEIVVDGESRWVTAGYLSEEKPAETGLDVSCENGSTIATPVSPNIVKVHEVVCGNFPDITTYGTLRSDGEHGQGLAIDIMVSGDRGYEVADFLQANYAELGINYLIYSQRIWSVDRSSEGWRAMEDRGSTTANHYDHVHVTTY
ncbi:hypothetical protein GCM10009737_34530 [Nocardioides lentus]|uniref:ARB-07466-like C-terminal domain-containing protein n=1 Tax=Nocardioides lentus TaxID=338077 RepID=A0ABP5B6C3_9ACTN